MVAVLSLSFLLFVMGCGPTAGARPERAPARSNRGPTIATLTITPEHPAPGDEATANVVIRDARGVAGFRVSFDGDTKEVSCANRKECSRTFTRTVPDTPSRTLTLTIIAQNTAGQRSRVDREIVLAGRAPATACGDGRCDTGESATCPADCGKRTPAQRNAPTGDREVSSRPARATRSRGGAEWGFFAISEAGGALQGLNDVRWSRITGLVWPKIEAPIGSGRYSWHVMDERVRTAGKNGYNLVFVLKTGNDPKVSERACFNALSQSGNRDAHLVSCPPKREYEAAWKRLVQTIIERYDGDGRDDMPGLARGFAVEVQIENESGGPTFWAPDRKGDARGAVEPYLRLLRLSKEARDAANPGTRIIATGFIHPETLAECSSGRGDACSTPFHTRNRGFTLEVLKHPELFDAIDVHMFTYYRFSAGRVEAALQWFHDQMKTNGYAKPIYSLEWTGSMLKDLKAHDQDDEFLAHFPYRKEFPNRQRLQETYQDLANPKNKKYRSWFEAEQAREFPKLFTVLLANDVKRLIHVQFHDYTGFGWKSTWWNWQGIIRYAGSRQRPVAIRKPAYYAYQMLSEKIAGFTSVDSVDVGKDATAYRYGFANRNPVFVVWARGDRAQVPLAKQLGATRVRLTPFVTELDARDRPVRAPAETSSGGTVPLTDTPMLVEVP